jgi:ABC-type sugar transport system ATPase subunit
LLGRNGEGKSTLSKLLWIAGIVIFPVVGFVVWLLAGPRAGTVRV